MQEREASELTRMKQKNLSVSTACVWKKWLPGQHLVKGEKGLGSTFMKADGPAHCNSFGATYGQFMNPAVILWALCAFTSCDGHLL